MVMDFKNEKYGKGCEKNNVIGENSEDEIPTSNKKEDKNIKETGIELNKTKQNGQTSKLLEEKQSQPVKRRPGRPTSENSGYKVKIHKTSFYSYLSVQRKREHNGKKYYCHYHLGPLNDNNEFVPGRNYLFAPAEFKEKLIFPKGVKMNKLEELNAIYLENKAIINRIKDKEKIKVKEKEFELV